MTPVLLLLLGLAVVGLVIGAFGRLLVPGRNPMGVFSTMLVGLAGSFLGGLVARELLGFRLRYAGVAGLVLSVVFTALIVYALQGSSRRPRRRLP
jgi:uncharacterized membrane protein YeaQ/YmgE (transglycosylase-associated protein family)